MEYSNETRRPTQTELESLMQKLRRHQYHDKRPKPRTSLCVKITVRPRTVTGPPGSVSRLVIADTEKVRDTNFPPMPMLLPVNNLSTAQWDLLDSISVRSEDLDLTILNQTLSCPASSFASVLSLPLPLSPANDLRSIQSIYAITC